MNADHQHGRGHEAHDDLRYFTHEAQPEVFAATAALTAAAAADQAAVEAAVRAFLGRLSPALAAAGCVLVGHIKGVIAGASGEELEFSLTSLGGEPRFGGALSTPVTHAELTLNVIVFGVDARALPGLVTAAWPGDGLTAGW